jgi:hypothetical protein
MLPEWMQMRFVVTEEGKELKGQNNAKSITNPITMNRIAVMPRSTSSTEADKNGRSATAAFQFYDEFEWMPFNEIVHNAAVFAYTRASENAEKNGSLSIISYSSTPADPESRDGKTALRFIDMMYRWEEKLFDEPINKVRKTLMQHKYNGVIYVEHNRKQLGLSEKWYEKLCKNVSYNQEVILREIELQRIVSSALSPFKRDDIIFLTSNQKPHVEAYDPLHILVPIYIFEKINKKIPYIIGVDPSEGLSQDNSAMVVVNPYTQKCVAEFKTPYISQPMFAKLISNFMSQFCPKALVVVESNRGREVINTLLAGKYRYQVWYDTGKLIDKVVEKTDDYGILQQESKIRRAYGFDTTVKSRKVLFEILENMVTEARDKIDTPFVIKDICTLIRKPNGKIEASEGNHDDVVMAYLVALCVLYNADNLEEWEIVRGASAPADPDKPLTPEESMNRLKSLLPLLGNSPELKEMIEGVVNTQTPIQRENEYYAEIQRARRMSNYDDDSRFVTDDDIENRFVQRERDIFDNNFLVDTTVNIDDFIQ